MHFGIVTPPVPGHIHPFGALGRELISRGHRVTVFHMPDIAERIANEGLEFVPIGASDHPKGSLPVSLAELGKHKGTAALRFTIKAVAKTTNMMLRDAPVAMREAGVQMILADQMEPAGCALSEHLGIPFVTICNALLLNREPGMPPAFSPFPYSASPLARVRNRVGYAVSDFMTRPIRKVVERYRADWGLKPHAIADESFSSLAQISQLPRQFDFPRHALPPTFHYVGPVRGASTKKIPFPWERLDSRPLVYASLGTLQNSRLDVFRAFADACAGLSVQLVITHGGGLDEASAATLPREAIVVSYAPQLELLKRATLTLTHAGLNTVLDTLSCGVPMVAIPITYEQPAIAERVRRCGAGEMLDLDKLTAATLRPLIEKVLDTSSYAGHARTMAAHIAKARGVMRAAEIIEQVAGCS